MSVCFEDVYGGWLGVCVEGVQRCDSYFHSGGVELWCGLAAEELINKEGCDWVFGTLWWWGHCWAGGRFPVAFVGGKGVECAGRDVLRLSLQDNAARCARIFG